MTVYNGVTMPELPTAEVLAYDYEAEIDAMARKCGDMIVELIRRSPKQFLTWLRNYQGQPEDFYRMMEELTNELSGQDADEDRQLYSDLRGGG